jgi:hypothetical protein
MAQVLLNMAPQLVQIAEERKHKLIQESQVARAEKQQQALLEHQRAQQQRQYSEAEMLAAFSHLPEETRSLYMQVLSLGPDHMAELPAEQQQQVIFLKQQAMGLLSQLMHQ